MGSLCPVAEPTEPTGAPPVVVDFQLTGEEFRRALRWAIRRRPLFPVLAALGPVFIVIGLLVGGHTGGLLGGVGVGLLVLLLLSLSLSPAIAWRRNAWARGPRTLSFSDEGVQTRTPVSEGLMQWRAFKTTDETDHCYMLRMANRAYVIVLKRAFATAQDQARFRELIERHTAARLWSTHT